MSDYVEIRIPRDLYERIEKLVERTKKYGGVEDYIKLVLENALEEEEEEVYTEEDEKKIMDRLRSLGYI